MLKILWLFYGHSVYRHVQVLEQQSVQYFLYRQNATVRCRISMRQISDCIVQKYHASKIY